MHQSYTLQYFDSPLALEEANYQDLTSLPNATRLALAYMSHASCLRLAYKPCAVHVQAILDSSDSFHPAVRLSVRVSIDSLSCQSLKPGKMLLLARRLNSCRQHHPQVGKALVASSLMSLFFQLADVKLVRKQVFIELLVSLCSDAATILL